MAVKGGICSFCGLECLSGWHAITKMYNCTIVHGTHPTLCRCWLAAPAPLFFSPAVALSAESLSGSPSSWTSAAAAPRPAIQSAVSPSLDGRVQQTVQVTGPGAERRWSRPRRERRLPVITIPTVIVATVLTKNEGLTHPMSMTLERGNFSRSYPKEFGWKRMARKYFPKAWYIHNLLSPTSLKNCRMYWRKYRLQCNFIS